MRSVGGLNLYTKSQTEVPFETKIETYKVIYISIKDVVVQKYMLVDPVFSNR